MKALVLSKQQEEKNGKEEKPAKYVNSNIPLLEEQHLQLRILALQQGRTLKDMLTEMVGEYLAKMKVD